MMEGELASSNTGWEWSFFARELFSSDRGFIRTESAMSEVKKAPEDEVQEPKIDAQKLALADGIDFVDCSDSWWGVSAVVRTLGVWEDRCVGIPRRSALSCRRSGLRASAQRTLLPRQRSATNCTGKHHRDGRPATGLSHHQHPLDGSATDADVPDADRRVRFAMESR
jgi:hypothetical protein